MRSMRIARMRKPFSSRWARILPALPAASASGLMIARVKLMCFCGVRVWAARGSGAEQLADDVTAREEAGQLAFTGDGKLLDVLVDHHVGGLLEAELLGDAQHGARHDVLDLEGGGHGGGAGILADPGDVRQQAAHDVPLG